MPECSFTEQRTRFPFGRLIKITNKEIAFVRSSSARGSLILLDKSLVFSIFLWPSMNSKWV
jgi:hypothetical protein